jgi:hypothetical protein
MMLTRYLFIFWLKNPAAFQDEFWSFFGNIWVTIISCIVQIVFEVMLSTDSYHIYICTGAPPPVLLPGQKLVGSSSINLLIQLLTLVIHVVVLLRIRVYKWRKPSSGNVASPRSKLFWLMGLEKRTLTDITMNFISVLFFGVSQIQIRFQDIGDLNHYPNYLSEYFYRLIRVPVMMHLLVIVVFIRHSDLRLSVLREIQHFMGKLK